MTKYNMAYQRLADARQYAADALNEKLSPMFKIDFATLEREVNESKPETSDILLKRRFYRQYLEDIGPSEPRNLEDKNYQAQKARYLKYKLEKLDPFDKKTREVEAQQRAVQKYKKEGSKSFAGWTFEKLEREVKESSPKTKNIEQKRKIYEQYLADIRPQEPGQLEGVVEPHQRQGEQQEEFSRRQEAYTKLQEAHSKSVEAYTRETKEHEARVQQFERQRAPLQEGLARERENSASARFSNLVRGLINSGATEVGASRSAPPTSQQGKAKGTQSQRQ